MKNLKEYIVEGIFDIDDNIDNVDESIRDQIKRFLNDNFDGASSCKISHKPNADGKYEVSSTGNIEVKNKKITSLTNGMFIWVKVSGCFSCWNCRSLITLKGVPEYVGGYFDCSDCDSLTSLEGAPKKVSGYFDCDGCTSLTSLEGAPKKVGGDFCCSGCKSLTTLKGVPEKVSGNFDCNECTSLTSLEGAPKEVRGNFICFWCKSLTSLEGAPKKIRGNFDCMDCHVAFTKDDVEKVSNVKGRIEV